MSATWVVPELGADFTQDFEDLLIAYIYNRWTITDPAKGTVMQPNTQTEPGKIGFKPGFPDFHRPYEVVCKQTVTTPLEKLDYSVFVFTTTVEVGLRMKRLKRDAIEFDPQLDNMEQEIERIVLSYHGWAPQDIPGIQDLYFETPTSFSRVYGASDNYAKSDWRSVAYVRMKYSKQNTI